MLVGDEAWVVAVMQRSSGVTQWGVMPGAEVWGQLFRGGFLQTEHDPECWRGAGER